MEIVVLHCYLLKRSKFSKVYEIKINPHKRIRDPYIDLQRYADLASLELLNSICVWYFMFVENTRPIEGSITVTDVNVTGSTFGRVLTGYGS